MIPELRGQVGGANRDVLSVFRNKLLHVSMWRKQLVELFSAECRVQMSCGGCVEAAGEETGCVAVGSAMETAVAECIWVKSGVVALK
jgi:hypothetical protein